MECSWDDALLRQGDDLPPELLQIIQHGSDAQYLEALTRTALDARYTYTLLAHCEDVFAHVCASLRSYASLATSVATLGRIVPHAPFLTPYAVRLLEFEQHVLSSSRNDSEDLLYLLGLFRLLSFDHRIFRRYVCADQLAVRLGGGTPAATYLIIRILQIHLHAADHWFEATLRQYLGQDSPHRGIDGVWDEKTIDYRFLSLWEEDRSNAIRKSITARNVHLADGSVKAGRTVSSDNFHPSVALIGNVLLPRDMTAEGNASRSNVKLVNTNTTVQNLRHLVQALKSDQPTLLTGLPGAGKSLLVRHAAEALGKLDKMVTLHLNGQSDAKLLLGVYTTGETPGSFTWKPGVLTTAVQEGRWVLIEDLDRAPNEILGTLLPLVERRELLIPNRKETIHAAEGFRILATVRSSINHRGEENKSLSHMLGFRHWRSVAIQMPPMNELGLVAKSLFTGLEQLMPELAAVFARLSSTQSTLSRQSKTGTARLLSPRDLLKWCHRVSSLVRSRSTFTSSEIDAIYLEAIDCFIGALPEDEARSSMAALIAEELRIDPQRRDFLLGSREVQYAAEKNKIVIGRYTLPRSRQVKLSETSFSTNPHTTRMLERVTAAVTHREPLLLVGETGVGKTTAVQHLATHLGKKLVPFNLSQQSEAGDLLGGFKPVNARTLMIPMKDEFDDVFADSFSMTKNKQFLDLLGKQMARSNWKAVCKLWRQALRMVDQQRSPSPTREGEAPSKKRKVENKKLIDFARWDSFTSKLDGLERQLSSGNDALAFTFVEGNIVKAVRNGDWVLLDEINLASSDTLESIADLLDAHAPSLLLTEAGNIERIDAHPDFRVFAAMNPATDVGKKDLAPGIRSRFTELYVESPDKDLKSLQSIARAYLRQESASDAAIIKDISVLYQKIISLANDNKLVDGAGQRPHFSLRTLTRTLSFAKHIQHLCTLRRALYEGFQMSFLTFLDAESAQLVQPFIEQHLFGKRTNIKAELQKPLRRPNDGHAYVQGYVGSKSVPGSKHWIRQGTSEVHDEAHYIITPFIRENLENLVRAASTRQFPVLIQGPTSSGKTSMIEYLAKRTGHKFTRINNHEHTDLQEYLGTYVSDSEGRLHFQEGVLVQALREGHWLVLDELNLAPTDVLEALNRLLDDNRELLIPETQETIRPHPSFMLFATQNPAGLYGGRKTLSRAFRNRFLELHFDDIPVGELQEILHRRTQLPESRCKRIVAAYKELSILRQENRLFEQKSFATLRDLFRWALRQNDTIEQLAANGYMLLCERVRKQEERAALKAVIEKVMSEKGPRVRIDEHALYAKDCREIQEYANNAAHEGVVWTSAMRRLYVLVSRAIENNEPILLVGETGCGKTTVCQMLANALKKNLHMVNAHQNTETGDLIGSQRPVRNRAGIEEALRTRLLSLQVPQLQQDSVATTEQLLMSYDAAVAAMETQQKAAHLQSSQHADVQLLRTRCKALFEWVDGSLVQAMRNGDFFLLDEISLADDSVLERINSVLESQRTILLAEKGTLDSHITAAPGFQFFATMNPGGDYGKRELSPALRNRFTEIWVPSLSDTSDVHQIVSAKLVEAALPFAEPMIDFASWFKARFDTSSSSSVSIRDVLAWVEFINAFASQDVIAAVVHGAALVYIDTLGANPAGLMSPVSQSLADEREACVSELSRLLQVDCHRIYRQSFDVSSDDTTFGIGPFKLARTSGRTAAPLAFSFDPPTTRSNVLRVLRALQLRKPVMLEGSPGVGKTALITAVAGAVCMPLTRINLSDQTDLLDLFGSDAPVEGAQTGTFVWRDAPFLRAMKNGEWVLLDEMNLASQSVLEGLNACLDHRGEVFVPELGQSFSQHPNFRLFAAQNPHHQGGGRKGLPASFVNRFTVVYADSFRSDDLMLICERTFPALDKTNIEQAVRFVSTINEDVAHRRVFGSAGSPWEFNLRDIVRWLSLACSEEGLLKAGTPHDFVDAFFTQRFRSASDRSCAEALFASVFQDKIAKADLFCNSSSQTLQVGLGLLSRDPLYAMPQRTRSSKSQAKAHVRQLQAVTLCIQRAWPVVLVGPSGAGKTAMIESLAATVGADVTTLAMNAETDALDLIGGYEQADPQRVATGTLNTIQEHMHDHSRLSLARGSISEAGVILQTLHDLGTDYTDPIVLDKLAHLQPRGLAEVVAPLVELLRSPAIIDKAKFEWIDGPLIDALQQGKWLVLDNANLCSASVLDRLNSLLEPDGTLIVNENSTADGCPRVIRPHADFRIFLTVDPRHGELSRAMRNRAVELYLDLNDDDRPASADVLPLESTMARFRSMKFADGDSESVAVSIDHLAISDRDLHPRLQSQLAQGLYAGLPRVIDASVALPLEAMAASTNVTNEVEELYRATSSYMQVPADFACVQTFHPLNNQPFVQQSQHSFSKALSLAAQFDLAISCRSVSRALDSAKSNRKLSDQLVRFWKAAKQDISNASRGTKSPLDILEKALQPISAWLRETQLLAADDSPAIKKTVNGLLSFCTALLQAVSSGSIDLGMLTVFSIVATSVCSQKLSDGHQLSPVFARVQQAMSELAVKARGNTGYCYIALWKALRPSMPTTQDQLEAMISLEAVIDRFDQAVANFSLPIQQVVDLRMAFQRSLSVRTTATTDLQSLVERATTAMPSHVASVEEYSGSPFKPVFATTFESLCQHFAVLMLDRQCLDPSECARLEYLAGRRSIDGLSVAITNTHDSAQSSLRLLGLHLPSGDDRTANSDSSDRLRNSTISSTVLSDLSNVSQVSLGALSLLEAESSALGRTVATKAHLVHADGLRALDKALETLVVAVLQGVAKEHGSIKLAEWCSRLQSMLADRTPIATSPDLETLDHSYAPAAKRLWTVAQYLGSESKHLAPTASNACLAWQCFALACVELFCPDRVFDPIHEAHLHRAIYQNTKGNLESRLRALKAFRNAWVGEQDCLRARLLQEDIDALGSGPTVVHICRPSTSQVSELQNEFQALLRITQSIRQDEVPAQGEQLFEPSTWSNLAVIRKRLQQNYRYYSDLTMPVVGFIDCLYVAQELAMRAAREAAVQSDDMSIGRITPFVQSGMIDWLSDDHFVTARRSCRSRDEQLYWLRALAVRTKTSPASHISEDLRVAVDETFRGFYEAWKVELSRDQRQAQAKSSLYKYQGGDDNQDEVAQEELDELFPTYDSDDTVPKASSSGRSGAQALAPLMAKLYHSIYSPDSSSSEDFVSLLSQWIELSTGVATTADSGPESLPALLFALDKLTQDLSPHAPSRKYTNIYTDANIGQSRALVKLVQNVQARFKTIHDAWPEHAIPIEVRRACSQILALGHSEPLARYLPSVEKLHAVIDEWQKVASSEYSAATLLEQSTNLIVSWRQLELSTWAGMFNTEDEAAHRNAQSWWYIAYESIVGAAHESLSGVQDAHLLPRQLVETLGTYIQSSGLGEYSIRLSMLRDFEAALSSGSSQASISIREALASVVSFYSRFEEAVAEQLSKKRAELEKDIKNVVQLASWKDRNIETLKQSAKTSHKKLFKAVRKYRQLLSEPVSSIVQAELPAHKGDLAEHVISVRAVSATTNGTSFEHAILPPWLNPKEVEEATEEIEARLRSMQSNFTASKKITKFLQDLEAESSELRKATPDIATEANKTVVQHLKTRKRRLFADVLRDLHLMGFQSNLSEDVLSQQSSSHAVLAKAPPLKFHSNLDGLDTADWEFQQLVQVMPGAREAAAKHNEDLTPAEVSRSLMLLESMLQTSLSQRDVLCRHLKSFTTLRSACDQFDAVCSAEKLSVCSRRSPKLTLRATVSTLLDILHMAIRCLEAQARLSGSEYTDVLQQLRLARDELATVVRDLDAEAPLPPYIGSESLEQRQDLFSGLAARINAQVEQAVDLHPELEPVLSQLGRWICVDSLRDMNAQSLGQAFEATTATSDAWLHKLSEVLKYSTTSVSKIGTLTNNGPDKKAWLMQQCGSIHGAIETLQLDKVGEELTTLLHSLHSISLEGTEGLEQIAAASRGLQPMLKAYVDASASLLEQTCHLHGTSSKLASKLANYFVQLARQGFCQPSEKAQGEEKAGQVESGTGLGDGEGGEDISKDVGDDEDLSELAQESKSKEKDGETEAEKDAVDMADEDLEGDFDEDAGSGAEEDDQGSGEEVGAEIDEEAGRVNEDTDDVKDDKTWNDGKQEEADKEADSGKGTKSEDVSASNEDAKGGDEQEMLEAASDAEDDHGPPDVDKADPHIDQEDNLDLPEDIDMSRDKKSPDEVSDADSDFGDDVENVDGDDTDPARTEEEDPIQGEGEEDDKQQDDTGEATAMEQDEGAGDDQDDKASDVAMLDEQEIDDQPADGLVSADEGRGQQEQDSAQQASGAQAGAEQTEPEQDADQPSEQPGTADGTSRTQQASSSGQAQPGQEQQADQPFKQLGDVLKQWYDQHRHIEAAQEQDEAEPDAQNDVDMNDARFEHTEDAQAEMQALGAAQAEQSRALDNEKAVPIEQNDDEIVDEANKVEDEQPRESAIDQDSTNRTATEGVDADARTEKAMVGPPADVEIELDGALEDGVSDDMDDVDDRLTSTHLNQDETNFPSWEEARQTWSEHEARTRNMAVVLTEHLRLILQPTQATKMRGDFRTGKRLNIKKIIPYIASSYKRDKIWMRRSIPSKRSYQIMLAIDDSESMNESERKTLAFDTLALIAKSMSMLEVGELCIVGFGETININHDFSMPFTSDAGAEVCRQFSFSQSKTDVRRLLEKSIELFREARMKATGSASNLWQLQLIISDGQCDDHPSIRQLVRQAHEEQIMVVFIIVDATASVTAAAGPKQSIVDLPRVEFTKDASGEPQMKMSKYLDTFPFKYYLIVRDVHELPNVLAGALRQWFVEVVESGG